MMRGYPFLIRVLLVYTVLLSREHALSQSEYWKVDWLEGGNRLFQNQIQHNQTGSIASEWFDVTYYSIDLTVSSDPRFLRGAVIVKGVCRESGNLSLTLDLINTMKIDSVFLNDYEVPYVQDTASFNVILNNPTVNGTELSLEIFYGGVPVPTGFGSFMFSFYGSDSWIWSLSQPYGARDWFPCKDHPSDKADSVDIIVTCDSVLTVGSNGRLLSVRGNNDGTRTHRWQERYPIASYLISIAIGRYEILRQWFRYSDEDSMDVVHYVLPVNVPSAEDNLFKTVGMLDIFSDLFGLYPFINDKYGHADIGSGGAMEHQTLTSTTTYNENVIAHELAHQWFGDMITCRSWHDIWLNEGFAQYAAALYLEKKYGTAAYWSYMRNQMNAARLSRGSVYVLDTTAVQNIFDGNLVYAKGATILHMLRHVLGDSTFFHSLFTYANDPEYIYKTAATQDFRTVCENVSGKDLGYFFNEWIYGTGYPRYSLSWSSDKAGMNDVVTVTITQRPNDGDPHYFTMPIDITASGEGMDTTVSVLNDSIRQTYLFTLPFTVKSVELDREGWLLKDVAEQNPQIFLLAQNYPNPFNGTTMIEFQIPRRSKILLEVFNLLGQKVRTLINDIRIIGRYSVVFDGRDLPSGIYVCRLSTSESSLSKKMIILR